MNFPFVFQIHDDSGHPLLFDYFSFSTRCLAFCGPGHSEARPPDTLTHRHICHCGVFSVTLAYCELCSLFLLGLLQSHPKTFPQTLSVPLPRRDTVTVIVVKSHPANTGVFPSELGLCWAGRISVYVNSPSYNVSRAHHYLICCQFIQYAHTDLKIMLEASVCILRLSRCWDGCINTQVRSVTRLGTNMLLSHETEGWCKLRVNQLGYFSCKKRESQLTLA